MTIEQLALSILVGIHGQESTWSTDAKTWQRGHHAAGPLQITEVCCTDFNQRNPDMPFKWPDDFLDRKTGLANSSVVYLDHCNHYGGRIQALHDRLPTTRELALIWRMGYARCVRENWADPYGYWGKIQKKNVRRNKGRARG